MIVYAGINSFLGGDLADVWALALDGSAWTQLFPTGGPPAARRGHTAVYDPSRHRMVIYGGSSGRGLSFFTMGDLWALDLSGSPAWTQLPSGSVRDAHTAIYDPVRDRMLVFGGERSFNDATNQVFAFDFAGGSWSELTPSGTPPAPRYSHVALYDGARRRMLVFGGINAGGSVVADSSVWALSLDEPMAWTSLADTAAVPGLPGAFGSGVAFEDATRDRMLIYGGTYGGTGHSGILADYPLGGGSWTQLSPSGTAAGRVDMTAVVDPTRRRAIVFGGVTSPSSPSGVNETWALSLDDPTPARPSLSEWSADARGVHLVWWAAGVDAASVTVERTDLDAVGSWSRLDPPRTAWPDRLVFDDAAVQAGRRYGYRLVSNAPDHHIVSGADWVTVPARVGLALAASPNPAQDQFAVACDLPDGAPARLELMDLAGRTVRAVDVAGGASGGRTVQFRLDAPRPGLYFLRLRQGSAVCVQRLCVAR